MKITKPPTLTLSSGNLIENGNIVLYYPGCCETLISRFDQKTEFISIFRNSVPKTVSCNKCSYKAAHKHGLILLKKSDHRGELFSIHLANQKG